MEESIQQQGYLLIEAAERFPNLATTYATVAIFYEGLPNAGDNSFSILFIMMPALFIMLMVLRMLLL